MRMPLRTIGAALIQGIQNPYTVQPQRCSKTGMVFFADRFYPFKLQS